MILAEKVSPGFYLGHVLVCEELGIAKSGHPVVSVVVAVIMVDRIIRTTVGAHVNLMSVRQ